MNSDNDPPPPVAVCGPDGRRALVESANAAHTVGDLADALGLPRRAAVVIDGQPVDRRVRLDKSGLAQGSRVTACPERARCRSERTPRPVPDDPEATATVAVTVEAGPAAGGVVSLPAGRHVIGRAATCAVHLDDDRVELHHAVLDVDPSGHVRFVQLAGRVPCRTLEADGTAGVPLAAGAELATDTAISTGASRIRLVELPKMSPPAALAPRRGDPWRVTLHRRPRQPPRFVAAPVAAPAAGPSRSLRSPGGLLAAALPMVAGVALAVVIGNPLFLVFSAAGFAAALASVVGGRLRERRRRRHDAAETTRDLQRFAAEVAAQHAERRTHQRVASPTIAAALATARQATAELWSRRAGDADAFTVSLGWGTIRWDPAVETPGDALDSATEAVVDRHRRLDDVPVTLDLGAGAGLAIVGEHGPAVARALVVQLAAFTGPADCKLVVVADDAVRWDWCRWLPHTFCAGEAEPLVVSADDAARLSAALARLDDVPLPSSCPGAPVRHVVVVTDRPDLLSTRTGALRRYLAAAPSVAVIAVVGDSGVVPPLCRSELQLGSLCAGRWTPDISAPTQSAHVHAAGVSAAAAADAARRLARIHDPEDPDEAAGACPAAVRLSAVLARRGIDALDDAIAVAAAWSAGDDAGDAHPRAAIGMTADGIVEIDLVADGPHTLVAGTTGAGKSELLRTFVVSLAATRSPDDLTFVLVDYKGGSTFDACAELPHTVGVVTDLDERLAERALVSLEAEILRRERLLRGAGATDLDTYRRSRSADDPPLPRLVVVIDEFATLAAELPDFLAALVGVAQRGRSLGIHLVLATQRPAGVVSDDIRANTNLRIALRLQDRAEAIDIVGAGEPATFPRGCPGRAMLRLGAGETVVFQAAHGSGEHRPVGDGHLRVRFSAVGSATQCDDGGDPAPPTELAALAGSIRAAASLCEIGLPFRPWLDPLPRLLTAETVADLGPGAVGLVDDPAGQRQFALRWEPSGGNLALIGALGSGTTTALRTLAMAGGPDPHWYLLDARGDGSLEPLAALANCGGVIGIHDAERRTRLIRFLADELSRRQADSAAPRPPIVLAIDGLPAVLAALSGPADLEDHARLVRILTDGVAAGIHAVVTMERPGGVAHAVLSALAQRWLFHLDDPAEALAIGVRAAAVPLAIPGRIVVVGAMVPAPGTRRGGGTPARLAVCEAQLAVLPITPRHRATGGALPAPQPIGTLPDDVDPSALPRSTYERLATRLTVGVDFATLGPSVLEVPDGEHVLVVGPARSGRSTALLRIVEAWREAHAAGVVVVHCDRAASPVLRIGGATVADDEPAIVAAIDTAERRILVVIDDAERVIDAGGNLTALVAERRPDVTVVAAGRPDALRSMYGHWTAIVRRSRLGIVMSGGLDLDGDLLGEPLPRRSPLAARPGLGWVIDAGGGRLVQLARQPAAGAAAGSALRLNASRQDTRLPLLRIDRE